VLAVDLLAAMMPVVLAVLNSLDPAIIYRYAKEAPPFLFTFVKATLALAFVSILVVLSGVHLEISPSYAVFLATLSGILGPGVGDATYTRSIQLLGGSLAVVVGFTYIFFAQGLSALILHEAVGFNAVIGAILAFTGVTVTSLDRRRGIYSLKGLIYALIAAICWSLAVVLVKAVQEYFNALLLAFLRITSALLTMPLISTIYGERKTFTKGFFVAATISGVLGWGVGMILYIQSVYLLGISVTTIALALTPVLSQITTKVISREKASLNVFIGALLVTLGITLQVFH